MEGQSGERSNKADDGQWVVGDNMDGRRIVKGGDAYWK